MEKNLAAALVKAQQAIRSVSKDSKHFQGYQYASSEAVIAEARHALNGAELALVSDWTFTPIAQDFNAPGVAGNVNVNYQLVHSSGESAAFQACTPAIVERGRPLDKAIAAALSYNLGYFLRNCLLIPRGEDDSVDARVDDPKASHNNSPVLPKAAPLQPQATIEQVKKIYQETLAEIKTMKTDEQREKVRSAIASLPKGGAERDALVKSYNVRAEVLKNESNGQAINANNT